jgi:ATP-dependent Zn protease
MSDELGAVYYEHRTEHPFLGQRLAMDGGTSDATVHAIEIQTRVQLANAVDEVEQIIDQHRVELDQLIAALLEEETLERHQLETILSMSAKIGDAAPAPALHTSGSR